MIKLGIAALDVQTSALSGLMGNGILTIYGGKRPATPESDIGESIALCEIPLGILLLARPGTIETDYIEDVTALDSGNATWFRCRQGNIPIFDGKVGESNADLIVSSTKFIKDSIITLKKFTYTIGK